MKPDLVRILEATHRIAPSTSEWMAGVLEAARPALDRGDGLSAILYDARDIEKLRVQSYIKGIDERVTSLLERSTPDFVRWVFRTESCGTASEGPDWMAQPVGAVGREFGFEDVFFVNGIDPSGAGCMLAVRLRQMETPTRSSVRTWTQIASHLASGLRMQRDAERAIGSDAGLPPPDAVLSPTGKIEHLESELAHANDTIAALRSAVLAMDRARGKARDNDDAEAVAGWTPLVDARWSLLDHFDHDGKRFVVVRSNEPDAPRALSLTKRERQVLFYGSLGHSNKMIAYELGITASTVGVLFARAAKKLRAGSRAEALATFRRETGEDE